MNTTRDERGLSNSVQFTLLLPLTFGILLLVLQWSLVHWAESTALAAAQEGAAVASAHDGSGAAGSTAARQVADNGSLHSVTVAVDRGVSQTSVTVTGTASVLLWSRPVIQTAIAPTERVT